MVIRRADFTPYYIERSLPSIEVHAMMRAMKKHPLLELDETEDGVLVVFLPTAMGVWYGWETVTGMWNVQYATGLFSERRVICSNLKQNLCQN